ncbi:hypothetical protein LPJ63_004339 [Coemansia sp. RSA 2711]|nr:hypothetical protein LPJ63_004339 [Coemansia sp. RSA 2711]
MEPTLTSASSGPATTELLDTLYAQFKNDAIFCSQISALKTQSEKRMCLASSAIRQEPQWTREAGESDRPWWTEVAQQHELTAAERQYVFDELEYYAKLPHSASVRLSPVDQVWISDECVDRAVTSELCVCAEQLRADSVWIGDEQTRYLVDPRRFPLVYSHSTYAHTIIKSLRAAARGKHLGWTPGSAGKWKQSLGAMARTRSPPYGISPRHFRYHMPTTRLGSSSSYSLLPAECSIDGSGNVEFESYINGIHTVDAANAYPAIGKVLAAMLPMFEQVLTDVAHPRSPRVACGLAAWATTLCGGRDDYLALDVDELGELWAQFMQTFVDPQPGQFAAPARPHNAHSLRRRRLQVIVEMSDVELTPNTPAYRGGGWQVDGSANDCILATGVYYYRMDNVTQGHVEFRQAVNGQIDYDECSGEAIRRVYGLDPRECPRVSQPLGRVEITPGLCMVYPNTYQHRTSGLQLRDRTKAGSCQRMLVHLVNPAGRVPSTELVPPQQAHWLAAQAPNVWTMPSRLVGRKSDYTRFAMQPGHAAEIRRSLVAEQAAAVDVVSRAIFEPEINHPWI